MKSVPKKLTSFLLKLRLIGTPASIVPIAWGLMAGFSYLSNWPVFHFAFLIGSVAAMRNLPRPTLYCALWGGAYQLAAGIWLLPAPPTFDLKILAAGGLFFGGFLFYGLGGLVLSWRHGWVLWPFTMAGSEFLASQLGYSLAPIGLSAIETPFAHMLKFGSIHAATILILLSALLAAHCLRRQYLPVAAMVLAISFLPGPKYAGAPSTVVKGISHAPTAHNKWDRTVAPTILNRLKQLTEDAGPADLIVWPENAVTTTFEIDEAIGQIGPQSIPLLFGMNRYSLDGRQDYINSAILIDEDNYIVSDKIHLAPILEGGFPLFQSAALLPGRRTKFTLKNGESFLALICYEAAFTIAAQDLAEIDFIVVISAETGFWPQMAAAIMQRHSKARSLETGLPIIRVSDTGF